MIRLLAFMVVFSNTAFAQLQFRVVDKDSQGGVESVIFRVEATPPYARTRLGPSEKDGSVSLAATCIAGQRLQARPLDPLMRVGEGECPYTKKVLEVRQADPILRKKADTLIVQGEFGKAALGYNQLLEAARQGAIPEQQKQIFLLEKVVIELTGKAMNIAKPTLYDPDQGKDVMSPDFQKTVIEYQQTQGLETTGKIDFKTLSILSGGRNRDLMDTSTRP